MNIEAFGSKNSINRQPHKDSGKYLKCSYYS